ncbi:heterokaryon incompatibility protein-domain-containing protein [Hypoxylon crocopeplum]|nr:heterokaryon incompatibility protein-domain-containing protein [Hypoxylon crocopeplum]
MLLVYKMYIHQPLNCENAEVRLVGFARVTDDNDKPRFTLKLRHESLADTSIGYAALSYVWGDPGGEMVEIEINEAPFFITQNLYTGLESLLRTTDQAAAPWFWIDAICINQCDQFEKSWQVAQMHEIYSRADLVYILLGLGSVETDRAMEFIDSVGPRAVASGTLELSFDQQQYKDLCDYIVARPCLPSQDSNEDYIGDSELSRFMYDLFHEKRLYPSAPPGEDLCAGIQELLRKGYWHRIWIIQEVVLAKHAMVVCGERSVSLDAFEGTLMAVFYCRRSGLRTVVAEYADFISDLPANAYSVMALVTRRQHRRGEQIRLAELLFQSGIAPQRPHYSASDPRDIVFALLGVISDGRQLGLVVDYSRTLVEVYASATKALIRDGDLHEDPFHLDRCVPRGDSERPDGLPSWVPDWEKIGRNGVLIYCNNYLQVFDAAAGMPPPRDEDNTSLLVLRRPGCYVDVITEVMPPPEWIQHDEWTTSAISDTSDWLKSIINFAGLGPESGPGEDYIWRTIMRDRRDGINRPNCREPAPASEGVLRFVRKVMRQEPMSADGLTAEEAEFVRSGIYNFSKIRPSLDTLSKQLSYMTRDWPHAIGSVCRGRSLFKTAKGMLGLGHVIIKPGDIVTLLWGINSPIILRPRDHDTTVGHTFVGDAYVDGIMQGEFLETEPAQEVFDIW